MGPTGIQWQEVALGRGKYRRLKKKLASFSINFLFFRFFFFFGITRKTVGFGAHDKRAKSWSDGEMYL